MFEIGFPWTLGEESVHPLAQSVYTICPIGGMAFFTMDRPKNYVSFDLGTSWL